MAGLNRSPIANAILQALDGAGPDGLNMSGIGYAMAEAGVVAARRPHISPHGAALMAGKHVKALIDWGWVQRLHVPWPEIAYGITRDGACVLEQDYGR